MNNKDKGKLGEDIASVYLKLKGYKIRERNFATKTGEVDIIAEDGDYIVFVEVKFRQSTTKGLPREAVTPFKQRQIKRTAMCYLSNNNLYENNIRFDVIEILKFKITHLEDAFQ